MEKIISLFKRDYEGTRQVYDEIVPGAEWVVAGEGKATVKWDGTCCMVADGVLYKRYDAKQGKTPPAGFVAAQDADPVTGHWPGWVPVRDDDPASRWHREAVAGGMPPDATYELVGPKVQGNPYEFNQHRLILHGDMVLPDAPHSFAELRAYFEANPAYEGIVWHHPNGRMVKIKARDFGLPWPSRKG